MGVILRNNLSIIWPGLTNLIYVEKQGVSTATQITLLETFWIRMSNGNMIKKPIRKTSTFNNLLCKNAVKRT